MAVLLLCLLTFFTVSAGPEGFPTSKFATSFILNLPSCIVIVYLDICVMNLTSRFFKLSPAWKICVDFLATGIVIAGLSILVNALFSLNENLDFLRLVMPSLLVGGVILLCVELYQFGVRHSYDSKRLLEIEKEKAKYQYEALKNQINPHFLFNCLNVIASLAYESPDKTNLFAKRLSNVYRYLLSTRTKHVVTVADELKFASEYVFLQQIRFEDNLKIAIGDYGEHGDRMIIPAAVQMSVENAIKHNVCNSTNPLEIVVEAKQDYVVVRNRINRLSCANGTGMGIENLREQFRNNGAEVVITETETEFIVKLPYLPVARE
jgi:Putative regulator of cell autolysis